MLAAALIFTTSFSVGLSGALTPGPLLAAALDQALRRGFRSGPLLVIGHMLAEVVVVLALILGLNELLASSAMAGAITSLIGAGFLLWTGVNMARSSRSETIPQEFAHLGERSEVASAPSAISRAHGPVVAGALFSLANPYWLIWWLTIGSSFLITSINMAGVAGALLFFVGHELSDLVWYSTVSFTVTKGRNFLTAKVVRNIYLFLGIFLVAFSLYFFWSFYHFVSLVRA